MEKPASLRLVLEEALPELAQNPENLIMFIEGGHVIASHAMNLNHEFVYSLIILISEFSGDIAHITTPILNWLHINQPDLLANDQKRKQDFMFNVTPKDHMRQDIDFKLNLSERVIVQDTNAGERTYTYAKEPPIPE